jgi:hypothetical protein
VSATDKPSSLGQLTKFIDAVIILVLILGTLDSSAVCKRDAVGMANGK